MHPARCNNRGAQVAAPAAATNGRVAASAQGGWANDGTRPLGRTCADSRAVVNVWALQLAVKQVKLCRLIGRRQPQADCRSRSVDPTAPAQTLAVEQGPRRLEVAQESDAVGQGTLANAVADEVTESSAASVVPIVQQLVSEGVSEIAPSAAAIRIRPIEPNDDTKPAVLQAVDGAPEPPDSARRLSPHTMQV